MLSPEEFVEAVRRKDVGNGHFKEAAYLPAIEAYEASLAAFAGRPGGNVLQRGEKTKVFANLAEACLKLERYEQARNACSNALDLDASHYKARFRRARACLLLGGCDDLIMASEDIKRIQADGGTLGEAEAALLRTAQGKLLLPGVGSKSSGRSKGGDADDAEQQADARARAAKAAAAVAPELALAAELATKGAAAAAAAGAAE